MKTEPLIKDSREPASVKDIRGDIVFENLSFGYDPNHLVLHDLNLYSGRPDGRFCRRNRGREKYSCKPAAQIL